VNDRISLTGLVVRGFHGVFESERRDGQDFVIDAVLEVDTRAAAASDDLAHTVDYGAVAAHVVAIIEGPSLDLVETLAQNLADACLGFVGVEVVEVVEAGSKTTDHPLAPAQIACENRVVLPGAFELTGAVANRICVQVTTDGDTDRACITVRPER